MRRLTPTQSLVLDGLRYAAAMMVALHHCLGYFYGDAYRAISQASFWTNLGSMGITVFFLLSGFVICYTALTKRHGNSEYDFRVYAIERAVRIYLVFAPAMFAAALVNAINIAYIGDNIGAERFFTPENFIVTISMLSGIVTGHSEIMPLIGQAWTINYEFWFYMLFGLLVLPIRGLGPLVQIVVRAAAFAAIFALCLNLSQFWYFFQAWAAGAAAAAVFVLLPKGRGEAAPVKSFQWIATAASFSYSLYLSHLVVIWACRMIGYESGLYVFNVNDWRKFAVFVVTLIMTNVVAYAFSLVTERHTNAVRRLVLARFGLSRRAVGTVRAA